MMATKVMVSLDSLVLETYAEMRKGGNLQRAKQVIREMIGRKHPNLWVRRVLTARNQDEAFYFDVRRYFGKEVHVSEHFCIDRNAIANYETVECTHDALPRRYCGYPSQRLVIASTGLVYPCCIDLHETMPVGDVKKQTIAEIWNGQALRDLRVNLRSDSPQMWSDTCRKCESWMSYDVPQRNFVQDVELTDSMPTIIGLTESKV
jgi:radical SAM protein with 4Fe4S-binding SPASM domain